MASGAAGLRDGKSIPASPSRCPLLLARDLPQAGYPSLEN